MIKTALGLLVSLVLFTLMFALGLSLRIEGLKRWWKSPGLPLRILLGSTLLVPLAGLLLLHLPWSRSIPAPERFAIALMAVCPSAPLALRKTRKTGGDHQLAALIQIGAALTAIASVPLMALLYRQSFGILSWQVHPLDVALQVGRVQVLPLLLALALRRWRGDLADRIELPLDRLANLLLILLVALVLLGTGPILLSELLRNGPAALVMALQAITALGIGWLLAGRANTHRLTTALVTAMRNPGLALLLASRHGAGMPGLKAAILIYVGVTLVVSLPLIRLARPEAP